ncbi:MAG TPA: ATP-binding protein [Clostridia bacterium]|nr:ATP-binding protein [Clostridia bacterium]
MIAFLCIIGTAFYFIATSLTQLVGDYLFESKIRSERAKAEELAVTLAPYCAAGDADRLYTQMVEAGRQLGGRLVVLDMDAKAQVDTYSEYNGMRLSFPEVLDIVVDNQPIAHGFHYMESQGARIQRTWPDWIRDKDRSHEWIGYFTAPIEQDARRVGVLLYQTSVQDMMDNLTVIQDQMLLYFFGTAIVVLALSLFFSRIITKPIQALTVGIQRMARGDLSSRVKVSGSGEMARLAETFNQMSEKLENLDNARNQFVSNASHELRTPLSTMKILLESMIYEQSMAPEMRQEFLQDINKEIDRLTLIIGDLLTLVRIDSGEIKLRREEMLLGSAVNETVRRLRPLMAERDQELVLQLQEDCILFADPMKIQQVVYNLLENAIKYSPNKGRVFIRVTHDAHHATLEISDSGVGIPQSEQAHIFDRFYRVDKARSRATGGTGLGLSIVKQIVLLHDGEITVKSEEGKGATFRVIFPLA